MNKLRLTYKKPDQYDLEEALQKYSHLYELCPVPIFYNTRSGTPKSQQIEVDVDFMDKRHITGFSLCEKLHFSTDASDVSSMYDIDDLLSILTALKRGGVQIVETTITEDGPILFNGADVCAVVAPRVWKEDE